LSKVHLVEVHETRGSNAWFRLEFGRSHRPFGFLKAACWDELFHLGVFRSKIIRDKLASRRLFPNYETAFVFHSLSGKRAEGLLRAEFLLYS
jgi:hypothetical protein